MYDENYRAQREYELDQERLRNPPPLPSAREQAAGSIIGLLMWLAMACLVYKLVITQH